jgi:hypothetical protein
MVMEDLTSQYTGGPVKATLNSQLQPLITGQNYMITANIYNDGSGVIEKIDSFQIRVPKALEIVSTSDSIATSFTDGCLIDKTNANYDTVTCKYNVANEKSSRYISNGEYKRISFLVKPSSLGTDIDRTTYLITGNAAYTYLKTASQILTIAAAPPQ